MAGLDSIKHFEDGGPTEEVATREPPLTSKSVAAKGPYALPTPMGRTGVDPVLLENMQQLIAEREAKKNSFMENLKDANAWWSGGQAGPGEALRARAAEREGQDATTFQMKSQLAQNKIAQQRESNLTNQIMGAPTAPGAPTTSGAPNIAGAPTNTGATALINLINDPALKQSIMTTMSSEGGGAALKQIHAYLAKNAEDPVLAKEIKYLLANNLIDPKLLPAAVLLKFAGTSAVVPHDVRGPSGTVQQTPLNSAQTLSPNVVAPTTAKTTNAVTGNIPNNNPGNIMYNDWVAKNLGAVGKASNGTAIFKDAQSGEKAQHDLLTGQYGSMPLNKVSATWAPAGHGNNNPEVYTKNIQQSTGFDDATMAKSYNQLNPQQQAAFRAAQLRQEHGVTAPKQAAETQSFLPHTKELPKIATTSNQAPLVAPSINTGFAPGSKEDLDVKKKAAESTINMQEKQQEPIEKAAGESAVALTKAAQNAATNIRQYDMAESILRQYPKAFGISQDGSVTAMLSQLIAPGVTVPIIGTLKVPGIEEARAQRLSPKAIAARQTFDSLTSRFATEYANQNLTGEGRGTLSNADLKMAGVAKGLSTSSPAASNLIFTVLNRENEQKILDRNNAWTSYQAEARKNGTKADFNSFRETDAYIKAGTDEEARVKRRFPEFFKEGATQEAHPGEALVEQYKTKKTK